MRKKKLASFLIIGCLLLATTLVNIIWVSAKLPITQLFAVIQFIYWIAIIAYIIGFPLDYVTAKRQGI